MLTHCALVLELLADGRSHSAHELIALHVIGHSRVSDLRRAGYQIEQWSQPDARSGRTVHLYELRGVPAAPSRFEEQLDAGGAWAAAQLLRRMRERQWPDGLREVGGEAAVDGLLAELELVEGELAAIAAAPSLDDSGRIEELQRRQREIESQLARVGGVAA